MKNTVYKIASTLLIAATTVACSEEAWSDLSLSSSEAYVITPTKGDAHHYSVYFNQNKLLVWGAAESAESSNTIKDFTDRSVAPLEGESVLYDFDFVEIRTIDDVVTEFRYEVREQVENEDIVDITITNLADDSAVVIEDAEIELLIKNI